jgi:adenosylhomocysteine nucleosidase
MTTLLFDDPCILFALGREASAFLREFRPQERFTGAPCRARFCGPAWLSVCVLETGVGTERAEQAAAWLLDGPTHGGVPYRPKVVLCVGYAGALRENFRPGDVILATEVVDTEGGIWPATWPGELPPGEWRPPLYRGRVVTTSQMVTRPERKAELGQRHDALVVDMESAAVAKQCHQRGVPFGCVRVVSDDLKTSLSPRLAGLVSGGRVSPWAFAALLATSPWLMGDLWRLAAWTRLASENLGKSLGELLTLTLPWAGDEPRSAT